MFIDELDWVGRRPIVALWKVSVVLSIRILWFSIEVIMSLLTVIWSIVPGVAWSVLVMLSICSIPIWVEASLSIGCLVVLVSVSGLLTKLLIILRPKVRSSSLIVVMSEDCSALLVVPCLLSFNLIIIGFSSAVHESVHFFGSMNRIWSYCLDLLSPFAGRD